MSWMTVMTALLIASTAHAFGGFIGSIVSKTGIEQIVLTCQSESALIRVVTDGSKSLRISSDKATLYGGTFSGWSKRSTNISLRGDVSAVRGGYAILTDDGSELQVLLKHDGAAFTVLFEKIKGDADLQQLADGPDLFRKGSEVFKGEGACPGDLVDAFESAPRQ